MNLRGSLEFVLKKNCTRECHTIQIHKKCTHCEIFLLRDSQCYFFMRVQTIPAPSSPTLRNGILSGYLEMIKSFGFSRNLVIVKANLKSTRL